MRRLLSGKHSKHRLLRIKTHVKGDSSHLSCICQQKKQNRFTEHCDLTGLWDSQSLSWGSINSTNIYTLRLNKPFAFHVLGSFDKIFAVVLLVCLCWMSPKTGCQSQAVYNHGV